MQRTRSTDHILVLPRSFTTKCAADRSTTMLFPLHSRSIMASKVSKPSGTNIDAALKPRAKAASSDPSLDVTSRPRAGSASADTMDDVETRCEKTHAIARNCHPPRRQHSRGAMTTIAGAPSSPSQLLHLPVMRYNHLTPHAHHPFPHRSGDVNTQETPAPVRISLCVQSYMYIDVHERGASKSSSSCNMTLFV